MVTNSLAEQGLEVDATVRCQRLRRQSSGRRSSPRPSGFLVVGSLATWLARSTLAAKHALGRASRSHAPSPDGGALRCAGVAIACRSQTMSELARALGWSKASASALVPVSRGNISTSREDADARPRVQSAMADADAHRATGRTEHAYDCASARTAWQYATTMHTSVRIGLAGGRHSAVVGHRDSGGGLGRGQGQ
jgi:hypothetical protein